jgi:hypothetical protein
MIPGDTPRVPNSVSEASLTSSPSLYKVLFPIAVQLGVGTTCRCASDMVRGGFAIRLIIGWKLIVCP